MVRPKPQIRSYRRGQATILVPVKMTPDLRQRFRLKAAQEDKTYAKLIEFLMDEHDKTLNRQLGQQVHPLDVRPASYYPGGGV